MKKAKIYIPTKTAMQSGKGKQKKWILLFDTKNSFYNSLMGWESSRDTLSEIKLEFDTKEKAKNNKIQFSVTEPKIKKFVIKSYADNFTKR